MARARVIAADGDWAAAAADRIGALVQAAVSARGRCHLVLAGGSTPAAVYAVLATRELPWDKLEIWFGDERCVPADHPDSNYAMAKATLLDHVRVAAVHRMRGEDPDRAAAAADYAAQLPDRLDVILLGVGEDGHTASLFPGQSPVGRVAVVNGPKPPPWRLTLTAEVLAQARDRVVLATGAGKADVVARALEGPLGAYPVQVAREGWWILDRAAASALRES